MKDKIVIFDTTLRDGEQSPGASMTLEEKVRIAKQLERMKVDVIEAGFAQASPGDFAAIEAVARAIKNSTVCSLARAQEQDIRRAGEAIKPASSGRIHTFIATSPIHMEKKLRMSADQVVDAAVAAIKLAKQYTDNIEFSAEDAVRSDFDFLCRIFDAAIKAGATTINVPDTVGYSVPHHWGNLFKNLIATVANSDKVIWSSHCHNDLGMAVANSLAAVECGARQVECTINGIGERAGNAALEEIVMAIKTRSDIFSVFTTIDASQIVSASKLVSQITGYQVQPNKAIVGANAFAHESGIHQDGVIKHRETYEIMRAQDVGWNENKLVLGKLSGRNAFKVRLSELGYEFTDDSQLNAAFARFKDLADKKQEIFDDDLQALITEEQIEDAQDHYRLQFSQVSSIVGKIPEAEIIVEVGSEEHKARANGSGPVDAIFSAIEKIAQSNSQLLLYSVNNITSGTDAQGEVTVRLSKNGRVVNGQGADTDIIIASAKAYLNALNRLHSAMEKMNPQESV